MSSTKQIIALTEKYGANNYAPLPVVLERGSGVWVWDVEGHKYMDMLSAYSALSCGHCHPELIAALEAQARRLTLTSRAFFGQKLGELCRRLAHITGLARVLPMNTGAEAVETALKAARKWGYAVRGVPADEAEIIVCHNNFHGRTISVISFSSEPEYREGFGPFTPGFRMIDFGSSEALEAAMTDRTVAFLVEPIQGEGGIIVPPAGYLARCAQLCRDRNVLLMVDEIQTGLGRTGRMFCYQHDDLTPDVVILGKALGGGVYPVSAVVATEAVMGVFEPGQHGSTFGGNPLGAAVALATLDLVEREDLAGRAARLGGELLARLGELDSPHIEELRGKGLLLGVAIKPSSGGARAFCEALMQEGLLCKETHETVVRLAPALTISEDELSWAVERLRRVLSPT